jgi:oligosaccharide translocation protein RFT1
LIKQFLSEGDKMVVGRFATIEDQGGYAVALNYGRFDLRALQI